MRKAGAEVKHGNIEDLDSLREGAAESDGVIHLAFNHDFSQFQTNCDNDHKAIVAIGEVLQGSDRAVRHHFRHRDRKQRGRQAVNGGRPDRLMESARGLRSGGQRAGGTRGEHLGGAAASSTRHV